MVVEFMMNALRLVDGVEWTLLEQRTGLTRGDLELQWSRLEASELVTVERCGTTPKGLRYLDSILEGFI